MRIMLSLLALIAATLIACGDEAGADTEPPDETPAGAAATGGGTTAMGPGLSIVEAKQSTLDGPLLVTGFIVARDGEVRLCEALAESMPPQCGGESLVVEGLALEPLQGMQESGGVRWTDEEVQLLGDVDGDTLEVSQTATG